MKLYVGAFLAFAVVAVYGAPQEPVTSSGGKHWALLVAGSSGWYNYRHQADVCHAYQILKNHGIPDERIVVMMYDDIAHNKENPFPGTIINHPHGTDVYHGVPKDYTKSEVTPQNFLDILQGYQNRMTGIGSGKVINSGPNDHIFVNFVDHGAPGIVAFPDGELHARDLIKAITHMHKNKQYAQMVLYIEACESGSMLKDLPDDVSVFATTASNAKESSYACYYDKKRQTYLGDLYSVNWMEDSDKEILSSESLEKQYDIVKQKTNRSHVQQFGNMKIANEFVADFQGKKASVPITYPEVPMDAVPSPDVPLAILHHRLTETKTEEERKPIIEEMMGIYDMIEEIRDKVKRITELVTKNKEMFTLISGKTKLITNYDCYEEVATQFSKSCYKLSHNLYAMRQLYIFVNLCESGYTASNIAESILKVCKK